MSRKEWDCSHCGQYLGELENGKMHIRTARSVNGRTYLVGGVVTAVCRCGKINEIDTRQDLAGAEQEK